MRNRHRRTHERGDGSSDGGAYASLSGEDSGGEEEDYGDDELSSLQQQVSANLDNIPHSHGHSNSNSVSHGHVRHASLMGLEDGGLEIVGEEGLEGEFEGVGGMMGGNVGMGIVAGGLM